MCLPTVSRRSLLRKSAVAGGAILAFSSAGAALASQTDATPVDQAGATPAGSPGATPMAAQEAPFASDIDVLNYALTLEHLEATFYRQGLTDIGEAGIESLGFLPGVFDYLNEVAAHEAAHVATLTDLITTLGGTPVQEATYDFGYTDPASFLNVAHTLEDVGVAAYTGAAQYLINSDELLTAALTIHAVEGRHAAYLAILNGQNPYPDATNTVLTPSEVLDMAGQFIQ